MYSIFLARATRVLLTDIGQADESGETKDPGISWASGLLGSLNPWLLCSTGVLFPFVCPSLAPGKLEPKSHFPEQFHHPPKINPPTNPNPSYSVSLIELLSAFDALAKLLFKDAILLGAARRRACKHSSGWNGCLSATGSNLLAGVFPGNAAYNCFPRTVQALFHLPTAFIHFVVLQL
uniref:HDC02996 n=1 Tax=Drosophila melanogaster TaxID=7227 RepID=Q6IH91_DROME|nr:TPA_inf: HDC02996 [Drosophila melanogaster]